MAAGWKTKGILKWSHKVIPLMVRSTSRSYRIQITATKNHRNNGRRFSMRMSGKSVVEDKDEGLLLHSNYIVYTYRNVHSSMWTIFFPSTKKRRRRTMKFQTHLRIEFVREWKNDCCQSIDWFIHIPEKGNWECPEAGFSDRFQNRICQFVSNNSFGWSITRQSTWPQTFRPEPGIIDFNCSPSPLAIPKGTRQKKQGPKVKMFEHPRTGFKLFEIVLILSVFIFIEFWNRQHSRGIREEIDHFSPCRIHVLCCID